MTTFPDLPLNQARAIQALLTCDSQRQAAKEAKVSLASIQRWLHGDPVFQAAWRQARSGMVEEAVTASQRHSTAALHVLVQVMHDGQSEAVRVSAAGKVLEIALKAFTSAELEERVVHLQQQIEELRHYAYPPPLAPRTRRA